jgi:hypothetical protein
VKPAELRKLLAEHLKGYQEAVANKTEWYGPAKKPR